MSDLIVLVLGSILLFLLLITGALDFISWMIETVKRAVIRIR